MLEGICYHKRWMLEASAKKVKPSDVIRFVGGGALSDFTCQVLADITGHVIETVENPQNIGAVGAAACVGVGMGLIPSFEQIKEFIPAKRTFTPDFALKEQVYDKGFEVFKSLYKQNKKCLPLSTPTNKICQTGKPQTDYNLHLHYLKATAYCDRFHLFL